MSFNSRRLYVSKACLPCRESKVKCDGASPVCSNCRSKSKNCQYQSGDDKRRLTLRAAIQLLSGRIDQLCQFITDHSLEPPLMDAEDHSTLMRVLDHQRLPRGILCKNVATNGATGDMKLTGKRSRSAEVAYTSDTSPNDAQQVDSEHSPASNWSKEIAAQWTQIEPIVGSGTNQLPIELQVGEHTSPGESFSTSLPEPVWTWQNDRVEYEEDPFSCLGNGILPDTASSNPLQTAQACHTIEPQVGIAQPHEGLSDSDETEALVDQLSERIGTLQIGPGGHIRYYGPTSNFNLVNMPDLDKLTMSRSVRNDGEGYLARRGLDKKIPSALEKHLVNLYFSWQDPALHVVNKDMYEAAKARWEEMEDTPYYSEALRNSICALGAAFETRYHPTFVTFPQSLAEFFADRAKALLEIELDQPCVATVQAMAVLSSHDVGNKRDSRGWLYSAMARRLAFDLGLHIDMTAHVAAGRLSHAEAELRKDVFWATYVVDHIWGFYLGKPLRINMEGVTVSKPTPDSYSGADQWLPYASPGSLERGTPILDHVNELHRQRVIMADIMAPVAYLVYGNLDIPRKTMQEINAETVAKLLKWKVELPTPLQVDEDDKQCSVLPHVLMLHMQYHQNIIHAHRPYMSRTYVQPFPPQGPGSDHARMMCIDSAVSISKLLQIHEIHYGLRRMNVQAVGIVCSAALLLIFACITHYPQHSAEQMERYLSGCFRALDQFGLSWESANKARDFLVLLQRQWERGRFARGQRRSSSTNEESAPRKRTRKSFPEGSIVGDQNFTLNSGQQLPAGLFRATGPVDADMSLDLEWILRGFPVPVSEESSDRL